MEVFDTDTYGRKVSLLYQESKGRELSVNREMVELGFAYCWSLINAKFPLLAVGLIAAEAKTRSSRKGVWKRSPRGQERPWVFRQHKGQA